jgi:hypothetical protein
MEAIAETEIDLTRFCAEENRFAAAMDRPWVNGGWRYACDGRIGVRVPAPSEADSKPPFGLRFPPAAEIFAPVSWEGLKLSPWPEDGWVDGKTPCWGCDGTGRVERQTCQRCEGKGEIECGECGHDYECPGCCGVGFTGRGKDCPTCDGKGEVSGLGRRVGKHLINPRYDRLVRSLPGVRFASGETAPPPTSPLPFVFGGGQGVVCGPKA